MSSDISIIPLPSAVDPTPVSLPAQNWQLYMCCPASPRPPGRIVPQTIETSPVEEENKKEKKHNENNKRGQEDEEIKCC